MVQKAKSILTQIFKVGFSVGLIVWMIQSGRLDLSKLSMLLTGFGLLIGLGLVAINMLLTSMRWRYLVQSQGAHLKSTTALRLTLIGIFFNFAMPGGVGGDLIKGYYFDKENPGKRALAITSVLFDRVLGLLAMMIMAVCALILDFDFVKHVTSLMNLFYFFSFLLFIFLFALGLIFSKRLHSSGLVHRLLNLLPLSAKFHKLYESLHVYGKSMTVNIVTVMISLVAQSCSVLFLYFVGQQSGFTDVPLKTYFLVAPIGFMATAIPISPAGVGVGQAAFLFLFNVYLNSETDIGPTVITALQMAQLVFGLIGAAMYLVYKKKQAAT